MDPRRFDELTRAMAGATTRRSVLRGIAAGVAGALAGIRPGLAAKPNRSCIPGGGPCDADTPCCRGAVCAGGVCCPEAQACGGVCCQAGAKCVDGACSASGGGSGAGCPAGSVRVGRNCLLVAGQPCAAGSACQTGVCADGVCCDGACTGQCEACDAAGACVPVAGAPVGSRTPCASDGSVCGGACDGANRAACSYPDATVACAAGVCRDGDAIPFVCDGGGACVEGSPDECGLFVCSDGGCLDPCADNDDCLDEAYCAGGVCRLDKAAGQPCAGRDECQSGFCVDGVCCDGACTGQCEACNLAGTVGACTVIAAGGAPVTGTSANRSVCASDGGVCAGACDGTNRTECAYPDALVSCRSESCVNGVATQAAVCDGNGNCPAPVTISCPAPQNGTATCAANGIDCAFACNSGYKACGSACIPLTSCCNASDCNGGTCANGLCVCGTTTCPAAKVCGPGGACTNGCFIRDKFNPNGKFWRKGDYNADGGAETLCRVCQPQLSLNFWVNTPAGNPCGDDCSKACNGDGTCGTGRATTIEDIRDLTTNPELCLFSCEMTNLQGQVVPCCHNCDGYSDPESRGLLGYCAGGICAGPLGRFSP